MKKITLYKFILIILIIVAIILSVLVIKKHLESNKVENEAQEVVAEIKKTKTETKKVDEQGQIEVIQKIDKEIGGYKVIGIIKIPKINLEYPILDKTETKSLSLSITKFWGEKINQIGNTCLAGHNNLNKKMFGRIKELKEGDIIELTDDQMVTVKYQVFKTEIIDPNDISCVFAEDETRREVTLITCTKGARYRYIVRAKEI